MTPLHALVTWQTTPLFPRWLVVALCAALAAAVLFGIVVMARRKVSWRWNAFLAVVRFAAIAVFALMLLQPSVSLSESEPQRGRLVVLVDESQSMNLPAAQGKSRWQQAAEALGSSALGKALSERFELERYTFAESARPARNGGDPDKAHGTTTKLADSLESLVRQQRAEGKSPRRVLLVTDGADHGVNDPVAAAKRLGLSIDVMMPASDQKPSPQNIAIAQVQSPARVLLGAETHFRVNVQGPADDADRKVKIVVREAGKSIDEANFAFNGKHAEQTFILPHRPDSAGLKQYEFVVEGSEAPAYKHTFQVLDSKYEILVLEDTWRWEYKFLQRLYEDDPNFRFTALLSRGKGTFAQFASPDRRVHLIGFPQNYAEMEAFDLFFLGDVDVTRWPRALPSALARLVAEEGKSLVVMAGPNLAKIAEVPELSNLLPVEIGEESGTPTEGPIEVRLRPEAASSPFFFQIRAGDSLPAIDRVYPAIRKRAGASVLLEAVKKRNPYGPLIVMAEHTVGKGRVLYIGTDTLWKWQTLAPSTDGPTPYATFWQQAFRALTPERTSVSPVQLWLTTSRSRVVVGAPVMVEAEVQTRQPLASPLVEGHVTVGEGRRLPLVFRADPAAPMRWRADFAAPAAGLSQITAQVQSQGKTLAEGNVHLLVQEPRAENEDAEIDRLGLARLAESTGGQIVDPARPETWPNPSEDSANQVVERVRTWDLWSNYSLLLMLASLLAVDWFTRLWRGLV
jgi:hypothetical protein